MKEVFYNSSGFNTACITVQSNNKNIDLCYHLHDNPVQHAWQKLYIESTGIKAGQSPAISFESALDKINSCLKQINYPILNTTVTQEQLNNLHNDFVDNFESNIWEEINVLIHILEDRLAERFTDYQRSFNFYSESNFDKIAIKEEFKLFLTTDNYWGNLLLGYATIGKDYIDILRNNDTLDDLAVQQYITSETFMNFGSEQPHALYENKKFYNWAKLSNMDIPLDNLNKLSLGRYMLGEIIITNTFLAFHPYPSDWYVPNHICKLTWNKEMLGADAKVTNIQFYNSNLYFETLMKHTNYEHCN
jgi:hypothetical protein